MIWKEITVQKGMPIYREIMSYFFANRQYKLFPSGITYARDVLDNHLIFYLHFPSKPKVEIKIPVSRKEMKIWNGGCIQDMAGLLDAKFKIHMAAHDFMEL